MHVGSVFLILPKLLEFMLIDLLDSEGRDGLFHPLNLRLCISRLCRSRLFHTLIGLSPCVDPSQYLVLPSVHGLTIISVITHVPFDRVGRFQHPVVLVREIQQPARHALDLESRKRSCI